MKYIKKSGGFTLVELLVSIGIVSAISLAFLSLNDSAVRRTKQEVFESQVETVLTSFRSSRADAISSKKVNGIVPEGGFGTHLAFVTTGSLPELIVTNFVDDNDDAGSGVKDGQYTPGGTADDDTVLSQENLISPWSFALENASPTMTLGNTLTGIFLPPNGEMIINDGDVSNDLRSAEIAFQRENSKKRICLNRVSRFLEIVSGDTCS